MADLLTSPPVTPPANDGAPPVVTPPDLPEFLKGAQLEQDMMNEPSIRNMKDLNSLVKSYVHAQKMVGADKITIPQKGAPTEQWNEVFTKLGLPKKEEYKINKSEKSFLGDDFYTKATELGHELGILPHQMQGFVQKLEVDAGAQFEARTQAATRNQEEAVNNLKKEWGTAFDAKLHNAKEVLKKFGGEEISNFISEAGLGNEPRFIKLLEKIGSSLKEARMIEGKDDSGSPADTQEALDSILKDKNHPYWDSNHVGHANAAKQVSDLFAKLN
jgi:hypothetical protein